MYALVLQEARAAKVNEIFVSLHTVPPASMLGHCYSYHIWSTANIQLFEPGNVQNRHVAQQKSRLQAIVLIFLDAYAAKNRGIRTRHLASGSQLDEAPKQTYG